MKSQLTRLKSFFGLVALATQPLFAFDPLMDEPEPFANWRLSKEVSYSGTTTPTWEA